MTDTGHLPPADLTGRELTAELATAKGDRLAALEAEREKRRVRAREFPAHVYGFRGGAK